MTFAFDSKPTLPDVQGTQTLSRIRLLRMWMVGKGVTWVAMGQHMTGVKGEPVTGNAVQQALRQSRMPVKNHEALLAAYPDLPLELLPTPLDVPTGPRPKMAENTVGVVHA